MQFFAHGSEVSIRDPLVTPVVRILIDDLGRGQRVRSDERLRIHPDSLVSRDPREINLQLKQSAALVYDLLTPKLTGGRSHDCFLRAFQSVYRRVATL